ncbi:hypothetical protein JCM8097_002342 [Rhodosporidiobolus ruineniae]
MADDLFSPPGSAAPSPSASDSAPASRANSPTLAQPDEPAAPAQPLAAPTAQPAFVPRAVKRKVPVKRAGGAGAVLAKAAAGGGMGGGGGATAAATASTSIAAPPAPSTAPIASTSTAPAPPLRAEPKLTPQEREHLEAVLRAVEESFSDWGLSLFGRGKGRLIAALREGGGRVHISHVLRLPNVRSLTGTLADVQRALRSRDSPVVNLDDSGFQVGRKSEPDYGRLETMDLAEWDDCVVYLENIPYTSSTDTSLVLFLSSLLSTPPQKLILPPLYDHENPPSLDDEEAEEDNEDSQAAAFRRAQSRQTSLSAGDGASPGDGSGAAREGKKPRALPAGGGPFKGVAFVVLPSKEAAEKAVERWAWDCAPTAPTQSRRDEEGEEDEEMEDVPVAEEAEGEGKKGKKGKRRERRKLTVEERASVAGLRALSYTRWLALKKEYFAYRRSLEVLLEAQQSGELEHLRAPAVARDLPPHLAKPPSSASAAPGSATQANKRGKRAASPTSPLFQQGALPPSSDGASSSHPSKRQKRPASPETALQKRITKIRTPPPSVDRDSPSALSVQGAYPEACVLWIRNVHEKSTKTSLKNLFIALLDQLQEGSGKGVEFVDYEKGTMMCYLRFASPSLADLVYSHLHSYPSIHLSQLSLSPLSALSPTSRSAAEADARRPLAVELLMGEQERRYWMAVPEAARKKAREQARGRVGLVKAPKEPGAGEPKKQDEGEKGVKRNREGKVVYEAPHWEEEDKPPTLEELEEAGREREEEEKPKKRKRPSRL